MHLQILKRASAGSDASDSELCNVLRPCRVVQVTVLFTLGKITAGVQYCLSRLLCRLTSSVRNLLLVYAHLSRFEFLDAGGVEVD